MQHMHELDQDIAWLRAADPVDQRTWAGWNAGTTPDDVLVWLRDQQAGHRGVEPTVRPTTSICRRSASRFTAEGNRGSPQNSLRRMIPVLQGSRLSREQKIDERAHRRRDDRVGPQ